MALKDPRVVAKLHMLGEHNICCGPKYIAESEHCRLSSNHAVNDTVERLHGRNVEGWTDDEGVICLQVMVIQPVEKSSVRFQALMREEILNLPKI